MTTLQMTTPAAGFHDPVQQSQRAFRILLDTMARPGRVMDQDFDCGHPGGIAPVLAAGLLTLADLDTPVWLGEGLDTPAMRDWLRFHTGAPLATGPGQAALVLLDAARMPALDVFSLGSDEAPERGATLLVQVPSLHAAAAAMTWRGPGIKESVAMPLCGLDEALWRQRAQLSAVFPRGLDIYLGCGRQVIGLPRSTVITFGEA
ncbi:phosphonate C-P lyase system protein PhnH [Ferrovibrio sp.]|uniref:phosphonate C-P lyase system protein PhnH n=1 Tax=Ferrovibrio sp. TaxID=1917215 RepID=UPI00263898F3|nr:phosphonate C-P lyase system protein PhnH [Ferrovibrio sp.]